jgi:hypothetical protein
MDAKRYVYLKQKVYGAGSSYGKPDIKNEDIAYEVNLETYKKIKKLLDKLTTPFSPY